MKIISKLTFKYISKNKFRTFLTIIGIIISIELIASLGNIFISTRSILTNESILVDGDYDFTVKNSNKDVERIIRKNPNIKDYYNIKAEDTVKIFKRDVGLGVDYYLGFDIVEAESKFYEKYSKPGFLLEGRFPKNSNEILVPIDMKDIYPGFEKIGNIVELGISKSLSTDNIGSLGEHFTANEVRVRKGQDLLEDFNNALSKVSDNDEKLYDLYSVTKDDMNFIVDNFDSLKKFVVVGYHSENSENITYNPFYYSRTIQNNINIITPTKDIVYQGDIFTLNDSIKSRYNTYAQLDNYDNLNKKMEDINFELSSIKKDGEFNLPLIKLKNSSLLRYGDVISYINLIIGLLIFIATFYFIYNIFALNYVERKKDFIDLKIIGLTNFQLITMIILDSIFYIIICVPIALLTCNIILELVYSHVNRILMESTLISDINIGITRNSFILWGTLILSFLTIFLANFLSCFTILNRFPIQSYKDDYSKNDSNLHRKFERKLKGNILFVIKNIKSNRKRFILRISTFSVGLTLFLIVSQFWIVSNESRLKNDSFNSNDLRLETTYNLYNNFESDLKKIKGINTKYKTLSYTGSFNVALNNESKVGDEIWTIISYDDVVFNQLFGEKNEKIFVSVYDVDEYGISGDFKKDKLGLVEDVKIELRDYYKNTSKSIIEKIEYFDIKKMMPDSYLEDSNILIMSEKKYKEFMSELGISLNSTKVTFIIDRFDFDKKVGYEIKSLLSKYPSTYQNFVPFQEYRILKVFMVSFMVVIAAVSIINIINTSYTNIIARRKEIAIKLSVGIDKNELRIIYMIENVVSLIISSIISFFLSIIFTLFTYIIINKDFQISLLEMMYRSFGKFVIIWLLSVLILFIIIIISILIPYNNVVKKRIMGILDQI